MKKKSHYSSQNWLTCRTGLDGRHTVWVLLFKNNTCTWLLAINNPTKGHTSVTTQENTGFKKSNNKSKDKHVCLSYKEHVYLILLNFPFDQKSRKIDFAHKKSLHLFPNCHMNSITVRRTHLQPFQRRGSRVINHTSFTVIDKHD